MNSSNKAAKRMSARRFRTHIKQISRVWTKGHLPMDLEGVYDDPFYPLRKEVFDSFELYCYQLRYAPDEPEAYRK